MNICSLVVHARPEKLGAVHTSLEGYPGVEVHAQSEEGKFVVTIEDTSDALAADTIMALGDIDGVLNTVLIYHYGGDETLAEEVTSETH